MALGATVQKLIAALELDDRKFKSGISSAEKSLGSLERKTSTFGRVGAEAGRGLGVAAHNLRTIGIVAGGVAVGGMIAATKAAIDFEDAFAGIQKTVDETELAAAGLTFEDLSDSIRGMAREIPVAATELAAIGEAAGALGIAGEDIETFTRVVAELGVTTDLTSETAATALGQLGNVLHLSGQEFEDFADSLVALGNAGASTESQIVQMAARFGAAGNAAGLTKEDILALSSALASVGIEVEAGGSALSRIFNSVATNIGTSSEKAQAFAETLGLSAGEFKKAWDRDALGTLQDFLAELDTLDQFEQANVLQKIGITNTRDVNAIRLLAQNTELLNDQLEISRTATGALGEEAAKKFATTASQIQILKNNLTDVGITIGSAVLPKITELTTQFAGVLNQPEVQAAIEEFAAGIPGVIDDVVRLAKGVPWGAIGTSLQLAGTGAKALLTAFTSLPPWVQTAVLTGWGLNKLTGGALGNIAGILTKSAFGAIRGSTPATPVFTKEVGLGGATGGGAAPVAAGGAGRLATAAKFILGPAAAVLIGSEIAQAINAQTINPAKEGAATRINAVIEGGNVDSMKSALAGIENQLTNGSPLEKIALGVSDIPIIGDALGNAADTLEAQRDLLRQRIAQAEQERAASSAFASSATQAWSKAQAQAYQQIQATQTAGRDTSAAVRTTASQTAVQLSRIESVGRDTAAAARGTTATLERKNFNPTINTSVEVNSTVSVNDVVRAAITQHVASGFRGGVSEF